MHNYFIYCKKIHSNEYGGFSCTLYRVGVILSYLRCLFLTFLRLGENLIVKIADFGFSEKLYTKAYVRMITDGVKLPVKWMAPESICYGMFSEKSDVVRLLIQIY